jgi:inorganic pyrophosphatase
MRFDDVPPCEPGGDRVHVVIDTQAGSPNKYKFDEKLGIFRLSRVLAAGLVFPYDFGSVPGTRARHCACFAKVSRANVIVLRINGCGMLPIL